MVHFSSVAVVSFWTLTGTGTHCLVHCPEHPKYEPLMGTRSMQINSYLSNLDILICHTSGGGWIISAKKCSLKQILTRQTIERKGFNVFMKHTSYSISEFSSWKMGQQTYCINEIFVQYFIKTSFEQWKEPNDYSEGSYTFKCKSKLTWPSAHDGATVATSRL